MKKTFTLIEVSISTLIIGILVVVIFQVYATILNLSIRIENEKILTNDILYLSQVLQNISDKDNAIAYSEYEDLFGVSTLSHTNGITDVLMLTGTDGTISIYATGDCLDDVNQIREMDNHCWIQMNRNGTLIDLTDKNKVYFTKVYFKIMPYEDIYKFNLDFDDIHHNGFWMFSDGYIKSYVSKSREFDVSLKSENFYNLRNY